MASQESHSPFSVDRLIRTAHEKAGVGDPCELDIPALHALCAGLESINDQLNFIGRIRSELLITETLVKRLRSANHLRRHPDISDVELRAPVFLVAPPRTGTTLLHRLLTMDPAHRAPRLWEALQAPPLEPEYQGDPSYFTSDYRVPIARRYLRMREQSAGDIASMHPSGPDLPEECFGLLETSLMSHSFMFYGPVLSYLDWLDERTDQDWLDVYRLYLNQVKLLHWWWPGERWVLKTPFHLWAVGALLETVPNAIVVQQHRSPATCVASFCSLTATAYRPILGNFDTHAIGRLALRYLRDALARNAAARERLGRGRFVDIDYDDLIADPIGSVERVYDAAGATLTQEAEGRMRDWLAEQRDQRKSGSGHAYALEDYGLNSAEVEEVFAPYSRFNT